MELGKLRGSHVWCIKQGREGGARRQGKNAERGNHDESSKSVLTVTANSACFALCAWPGFIRLRQRSREEGILRYVKECPFAVESRERLVLAERPHKGRGKIEFGHFSCYMRRLLSVACCCVYNLRVGWREGSSERTRLCVSENSQQAELSSAYSVFCPVPYGSIAWCILVYGVARYLVAS